MNRILPGLAVVVLLFCGCNKQAKINSAKIDILTRNILQFEQAQARQTAAFQSQLTALEPMLDKMNDYYFEKSHDEAFFFHTNTLYLVLAVDKKIESQLQVAETDRTAQNAQTYSYYTNQMGTLFAIQDTLAGQEGRITDKVNAETKQAGAAATEAVLNQIKLLVPDADEIARRKELAADVAEIKSELAQLKAQLAPPGAANK
jgi:hypothetical protein